MDVPVGEHITRITRTARYEFPSSVKTMAADFLPLLEITWKGREIMRTVHKTVVDRKRKSTEFIAKGSDKTPSFTYSFYSKSAAFV